MKTQKKTKRVTRKTGTATFKAVPKKDPFTAAPAIAKKKPRKIKHRGGIAERALIADLRIGTWTGRRKDQTVNQEVTDDKKADKDTGNWWTRLVPPTVLAPINAAATAGRRVHYSLTLPWGSADRRILAAPALMRYTAAMHLAESKFDDAVGTFVRLYPGILATAPKRLGDLYEAARDAFVPVDYLRERYYWKVKFEKVPEAADFRVNLDANTVAMIRADIEVSSRTAMEEAMQVLWTRLYTPLEKLAGKLAEPDAILRTSIVEGLVKICDTLPLMNLNGDEKLEEMRIEVIKHITAIDAETMRDDKVVRSTAARAADDILKRMKSYMG